jgi:hypothetical protein
MHKPIKIENVRVGEDCLADHPQHAYRLHKAILRSRRPEPSGNENYATRKSPITQANRPFGGTYHFHLQVRTIRKVDLKLVSCVTDPLRPYSRISRPEPLLFLPSSSSVVLTRLGGPRSRPTTSQKIW